MNKTIRLLLTYSLFSSHFILLIGQTNLTTSIIVPCHSTHAIHLTELLHNLEQQTMLPTEVIISLSDTLNVRPDIIKNLKKSFWAFPVTMITSTDIIHAGQNRNIACEYAKGDILICQDADDIPHPQRIAIIHHYFKKYDPEIVMHGYQLARPNEPLSFTNYSNFDAIRWIYPPHYQKVKGYITNGNISLRKSVFKQFKWSNDKRAQDTQFNAILFNNIDEKKRIVIVAKLYAYRQYLSTISTKTILSNKKIPTPNKSHKKIHALKIIEAPSSPNEIL